MTYEQIAEMMEEMGLPFAYHHFAEGESPAPPFPPMPASHGGGSPAGRCGKKDSADCSPR